MSDDKAGSFNNYLMDEISFRHINHSKNIMQLIAIVTDMLNGFSIINPTDYYSLNRAQALLN